MKRRVFLELAEDGDARFCGDCKAQFQDRDEGTTFCHYDVLFKAENDFGDLEFQRHEECVRDEELASKEAKDSTLGARVRALMSGALSSLGLRCAIEDHIASEKP